MKNLYQVIFCGEDSDTMQVPISFTKNTSEYEMIRVPNKNLDKAISQISVGNSQYGKIREEIESPGYMVDHYALKHSDNEKDALNIALIDNFPFMQMRSSSKKLLIETVQGIGLPINTGKIYETKGFDICLVFVYDTS